MPLDCWYALCTTLHGLCVHIMPGARRWPVRLSCQSAGSRWRLMERANNKRLAMIINMLMAIINTHSLTCIEESMCVCTVFMLQRFGKGGDSGYWVKIFSLGKATNTHTHIHTFIFSLSVYWLPDGRASRASHVLCLSCGLQRGGEEGSLRRWHDWCHIKMCLFSVCEHVRRAAVSDDVCAKPLIKTTESANGTMRGWLRKEEVAWKKKASGGR